KLFFASLFLTFFLSSTAQEHPKISVSLNNATIQQALDAIEKASGHQLYYDPIWLSSINSSITQTFTEQPLDQVFDAVLQNSTLNYFIADGKVVLTQNSIIYDKLPENFFGEGSKTLSQQPVFQGEYDSVRQQVTKGGVVFIGRESKNDPKANYTLTGLIKDQKTAQPVGNVIVRLKGSDISTETNDDGFFKLQVPAGNQIIETISPNHKKTSQHIVMYGDGSINVGIAENMNVLDEVVVTGQQNQSVRTAVSGVTNIDVEAIKNIPLVLGERDIMKVATTLPGVKVTGEGSAGYSVRGGKEDQNLILLDNAVLYNPAHFLGFFSAVNPFTTQKATIYKGSIPAEFGGRLSSVFDITTKDANHEKITGEGGIGPVTSNLAVGIPIVKGKAGLLVGGRATYSGWILRSLSNESLQNSSASFYDAIVKYDHQINDNNDVEATIYYSKDKFSITSDSLYNYSNRLISLRWNHDFNAKNKASLILTNSEYKFGIDYEAEGPDSFTFGYNINETQLMLKANYKMNDKHSFNYGFASKLYNIDPGNFKPTNDQSLMVPIDIASERALESAVYISDSYTISDKLLVDIGLRYSFYAALGPSTQRLYEPNVPLNDNTVIGENTYKDNEIIKTYSGLEPRIAARYFIGTDFSIKAGFDQTYQYIHLLSNNTTQSPTDTWKLSDLNVEPQLSRQYSLGLFKNLDNGGYELSTEGYFKQSSNILDYKVAAQLLLNENIETQLLQGEGKAYGVEFLLKKNKGRVNGWVGYTYSRTFIKLDSQFNDEKVNNGEYFAANFDKPHDFSAVLNYKFTQRYSFSANFVYQTGRPITYPIGSYQFGNAEYTLYSDRNKFRIPDYFRLDIGVNIEGNHKIKKLAHSFWNISIYNVLGRNNPYSVFFVTESGQIKAYQTSIFAMPIPTVTYNFKF
ncbi:MAG TPA: carboxypeptidase-like regulatory domain-containing protein, partial [Flavobacterium sp.]|nr:carboxypeptidase-like regulatory domain-containing protein [Flavobacterium sp.]